jgi:rod shape-determining protein MreC
VQALLELLWRARILFIWITLQILSLSVYIYSVENLRQRWLYLIETTTVAIHQALQWALQPILALRLYRQLEQQNAHLLEALSLQSQAQGPIVIPLQVWGHLFPPKTYEFIPVHSIYQTIHARKNYLLIDAGAHSGLYPGLAVINDRGLVGFIAETTATYSKVLPLFHENVQMAVQSAHKGYLGLTSWKNYRTFNEIEVLYVPLYAPIEVGEEIWSAPQSTLAPGGLRIGQVVQTLPEPVQGFQRLIVRTYLDWFRLGPLYVLKPASP